LLINDKVGSVVCV